MHISEAALTRLTDSGMEGPALAKFFRQMAVAMDLHGAASAALTLDYQEPSDPVTPETLIPMITVSLRPATLNEAPGSGGSESGD